ncbi:hypothetical protein ABPG74_015623 [Tetrahymena malaccensis]
MKSNQQHKSVLGLSNSQIFQKEMSKFQYFELPNPNSIDKFKRKFLAHTEDKETILEITEVQSDTSMFIGQNIASNGSFLNFNQIDPLLLAIPFLNASRGVVNDEKKGFFKQIDEIFKAEDNSLKESMQILQNNKRIFRNLKKICEFQSHDPDEKLDFFRLDNQKLKTYLDQKISKAQELFEKNEQHFQFQKLSTKEKINDSLYFGLEYVFNYLPNQLFNQLVLESRQISIDDFQNFKKSREPVPKYDFYDIHNENQSQQNNDQAKQKAKQITPSKPTTTEKKNQEAAKNTKSISSFFKKK